MGKEAFGPRSLMEVIARRELCMFVLSDHHNLAVLMKKLHASVQFLGNLGKKTDIYECEQVKDYHGGRLRRTKEARKRGRENSVRTRTPKQSD